MQEVDELLTRVVSGDACVDHLESLGRLTFVQNAFQLLRPDVLMPHSESERERVAESEDPDFAVRFLARDLVVTEPRRVDGLRSIRSNRTRVRRLDREQRALGCLNLRSFIWAAPHEAALPLGDNRAPRRHGQENRFLPRASFGGSSSSSILTRRAFHPRPVESCAKGAVVRSTVVLRITLSQQEARSSAVAPLFPGPSDIAPAV